MIQAGNRATESASPGCHGLSRRRYALAVTAVLVVALLPIALVTWPPLNDYPFRLASIRILQQIDPPGFFAAFYERRSFLVPNVATDLVVLGLARLMPLETAGRVFLALVQALTLGGTLWLHRIATGRRRDPFPLVAALFLHNWILLFGFLNFQLGVALILWALGAWLLVRERTVTMRLMVGVPAALVLFFCHMLAFGFYAVVVAAIELGAAYERRGTPARAGLDLAAGAAQFAPGIALFMRSSTFGGGSGGGVEFEPHWWWKPFAFARHFMSGNLYADGLTVLGGALLLALLVSSARVRLAHRLVPAVVALGLAFLVMPFGFYTAVHLDIRVPLLLWFAAVAALQVDFTSRAAASGFATAAAVLLVARTAIIDADWRAFDRVYDEVLTSFTAMPEGSALVVATAAGPPASLSEWMDHWRPQLTHVHALASVRQPVFSVAAWAHPAQQPFTIRPRLQGLYAFQNNNPAPVASVAALRSFGERARLRLRATDDPSGPPRPLFLLLLYPSRLTGAPAGWRRTGGSERFALYEIPVTRRGRDQADVGRAPMVATAKSTPPTTSAATPAIICCVVAPNRKLMQMAIATAGITGPNGARNCASATLPVMSAARSRSVAPHADR